MTMWDPKLEKGKIPLHESIVEALSRDIDAGILKPGDRLPTHRKLAEQLGVSLGTVTKALNVATARGMIHGETGRGTFIGSSAVRGFGVVGNNERKLIDMSRTWPLNALDPDIGFALRAIEKSPERQQLLQYQDNFGMDRHRRAGVQWISKLGLDVEPEQVVICAGVQHSIVVALSSLANPGDIVMAEELTYPGFKAAAQLLHLRVVGLSMDSEGIEPAAFEAACKQGKSRVLYCTPTIQNPTAATMSSERRREIVRIASTYGVSIIEDDVHRMLATDPPPSLAALYPENTYYIAGISKAVCGALRIAFLVPPVESVGMLAEHVWATTWMSSPLTAEVVSRWIEDGTADATVLRKKNEASRRIKLARKILFNYPFRSSEAGYHIWIELPNKWRPDLFAREAVRRGVCVSPPEAFKVSHDDQVNSIRVCLSSPWDVEALKLGLRRLRDTLDASPGYGPILV